MTSLTMMSTSLPPVTQSTQHVTLMSFRSSATFPRARTHSTRYMYIYSYAASVRAACLVGLADTGTYVCMYMYSNDMHRHAVVLVSDSARQLTVCGRCRLRADTCRRCGCSFSSTWVTLAPSASCTPASRSTSSSMRPPSSVRRRRSRLRSTCRPSRKQRPRMRSNIAPTSSKTVASNLLSLCHGKT